MYNTESCRLRDEEKFMEKSVEDIHSNSDAQTVESQRYHLNVERKSSLTSINKHENNHPVVFTVERADTKQTETYNNNKSVSNIDKTMQNNLKVDDTCMCNEKTCQVVKEVTQPAEKSKKRKRTFSLLDVLISLSIIGPLAIGFWRGVWAWMDLHTELFPGWFCFIFGAALHVSFAIFKDQFHDTYTNKWIELNWKKRLPYRALRILYTYTFGVACITHWRGGWIIIDDYLLTHVWITISLMCLLLACLAVLRCVRNLIATPLIIFIDIPSCVFQFPTRYNVNTRDWSLYLLDCAFSVGVVGTLVVFVWRGFWVLLDIYLFPDNPKYSAVGSLAIGYFIVALTFCLQPLMRYVCARLQGLVLLLAADAFLLLSFLGTVNVWRGIWNALDMWLLPDNLELSCWITHVGCFVFLVLLNCSNTILVRGVYIDAEETAGKCVVFPVQYLRLFFKIEREKKQARQQKLLVVPQDIEGRTECQKDSENGTLLPNNTANADSLA